MLPPWTVYTGLDYELTSPRRGRPTHLFSQELELGLPYRFGVAVENNVEAFHGDVQEATLSVEARYAFAAWNKIPLNPTVFAEYKFGLGRLNEGGAEGSLGETPGGELEKMARLARRNARHRAPRPHRRVEGDAGEDDGADLGRAQDRPDVPNSYELRLLLSQDFGDRLEWAFNFFFEQETSGDRGREIGFSSELRGAGVRRRDPTGAGNLGQGRQGPRPAGGGGFRRGPRAPEGGRGDAVSQRNARRRAERGEHLRHRSERVL